jgi:hypothetical protein
MIPCSIEKCRLKRFIDATLSVEGKTVRSLDAKHPVEMNTVNGTCYKISEVAKNNYNFPLCTSQRHVGRAKVQLHSISNSVQLNRRLSGQRNPYRQFGEEKNRLPLPEFEPRIVQPVA